MTDYVLRFTNYAAIGLTAIVSALLLFEHLALPLPLTDAQVPDVYRQIGREPGDFTVLSVPLGWRNSFGQLGAEDTRTQYYQAVSEKFLLTGQIQRNPQFMFDYFQNAPILSSIIQLETYHEILPEQQAADQASAADFVRFFDIRYVVINAPVPGRVPYSDTHDAVANYIQNVLPLGDKVYDQDGTIAYKVRQTPPPAELDIDLTDEGSTYYLGNGWTPIENVAREVGVWSTGQNARMFIPLRGESKDRQVTVHALPFDYAGHTQTLTLFANGQKINTVQMKPGWNDYSFSINHTALHAGLNEFTWQFAYIVKPSEALPANFVIGKTGVNSPVDIAVQSTGQFASIKVAGREVSQLKRGYNFAVIDPKSGAVLDTKNFDTGGESIVESRALTDFIKKLPDGVILAGAVQEEGATMLREGSAGALVALGLTDLRGTTGRTQAFIVVKGKPGGIEATSEVTSLVSVGHNIDTRPLGAAFHWLRVKPLNGQ